MAAEYTMHFEVRATHVRGLEPTWDELAHGIANTLRGMDEVVLGVTRGKSFGSARVRITSAHVDEATDEEADQ